MGDDKQTPIEQIEQALKEKGYMGITRFETGNVESTVAFTLWGKGGVYVLEQEFKDNGFNLWVELSNSLEISRSVEELP